MKPKFKPIKIIERKLGKEQAYGQAYKENRIIELDKRLSHPYRLEVIVHELLHVAYPWMTEEQVEDGAPQIAEALWRDRYRRIDQ